MPTVRIACPRCSRTLTTTRSFEAGSRLRCPKCGAAFVARPEDPPTAADAPAPVPGVQPLPLPLDEPPRRSVGWLPILGVVCIGLLLLIAAGVALAVRFSMNQEHRQATITPSTPAALASDTTAPTDKPSSDEPSGWKDRKHPPDKTPQGVGAPPDAPPQLAPPDAPPAGQSVLPPEQQEKVNKAIDRGVAFLMKAQHDDGSWARVHAAGLAALPGLTLLECCVSPDDSHVQKAADFVRKAVPSLTATYQLALAVLFLDRLGDPKDEPLIRSMALRLLAGESPAGGWTYLCPLVSEKDERILWTILETTRPRSSLDLIAKKSGGDGPADLFSGRTDDKAPNPPLGGGLIPLGLEPTEKERKEAKGMYDGLSDALKKMPALQPPAKEEKMPNADASDNSNTQFATLGLWAAGRHGVPMERALALLAKRFQVSQTPAGGWAYHYQPKPPGGETPTMTGAGLLGLAIGHGLTAGLKGSDVEPPGEDPQVEKGMKALSEDVGMKLQGPLVPGKGAGPHGSIYYFFWSVERVGMLYGRKTIGGKEWYPWGADELVELQESDGNWPRVYEAPTDTCFALLFLKRANFAKDLSTKLQFLSQVKEP